MLIQRKPWPVNLGYPPASAAAALLQYPNLRLSMKKKLNEDTKLISFRSFLSLHVRPNQKVKSRQEHVFHVKQRINKATRGAFRRF